MTNDGANGLPAAALEWVRAVTGLAIEEARSLGGSAQSVHRIRFRDGADAVIRRWTRPGWQAEDPEYTAAHEAASLRLLARLAYPAPRLLGVDETGTVCGAPAVLQTFIPGTRAPLRDHGSTCGAELASAAARLHAATAGCEDDIGLPYLRYYDAAALDIPAWGTDASLWRDAIGAARAIAPVGTSSGIHRDFHHGNAVWNEGRITAVVDWDRLSWGPPALDLAHACLNLAGETRGDLIPGMLGVYERLGNGLPGNLGYWMVADAVDAIPDMRPAPAAVAAVEGYLRAALGRLEGGD